MKVECKHCGNKILSDSFICNWRMEDSPYEVNCKQLTWTARYFCSNCGRTLDFVHRTAFYPARIAKNCETNGDYEEANID